MRLLRDLLHATGRERRPRLISVTGVAGIGKSRLAWEFAKYVDGLIEDIYWHEGRSPAYGEGITFWALGEMVRRRAGLAETDDERTTRGRIAATLEEFVPDEAERRWIEPALLALLAVAEVPPGGTESLFAAWRVFFERVAAQGTTVLVFEDLQWADSGLLDFIEHVVEWSRDVPLLVVTLSRPELLERRPDWGSRGRAYTSLRLEPLSEAEMADLLTGLVPSLPERARREIVARADGMPLYAVETVRMLLADGRLVARDGVIEPAGELGILGVPPRSMPSSRPVWTDWGRAIARCCRMPRWWGRASPLRPSPQCPGTTRRNWLLACGTSCAASSSAWSPTRDLPSVGSTPSCRPSSGRSPTARLPVATARPATSPPPATSSRSATRRSREP
jgi:hypothetical protein